MIKDMQEFSEAVFEKIRNMVSRLFNGDENVTCGVFVHQFSSDLLELAKTEVLKSIPKWKRGTPPHKGWWLTKTERRNGEVLIACEPWKDDEWPYEYENNVLYMDMNDLVNLPNED